MGWKVNPEAIAKTVSNWIPKGNKARKASGSLSGRKVSVTEGKSTEGLKDARKPSFRPHKIALPDRHAATTWGKALIKVGIAKREPTYTSPSSPKPVSVPGLKEKPEDISSLPRLNEDTVKTDIARTLHLNISEVSAGEGEFGEVRAAVSSEKLRRKPMRALKTTFNQNNSLEIELHSRLNHVNIAKLKSAYRSEELFTTGARKAGHAEAMEMEFVGQSLKDVINPTSKFRKLKPSDTDVPEKFKAMKSGEAVPVPSKMVRKVAAGTLNALNYMHRQDPAIIHCDIHPGNLLVTGSGRVKLTDFGCAKEHLPDGEVNGNKMFNAKYNGPEIWADRTFTPKTDIWGLGCIIFESATGESVCSMSPLACPQGKQEEYITKSAAKALEHTLLQTKENAALKDLLEHLLDPNPETRYSAKKAMQHPYFARTTDT